MDNELFVKRITLKANLEKLAGKINAAEWDEGNELPEGEYTAESLAWYLQREGTFFFELFFCQVLSKRNQTIHPFTPIRRSSLFFTVLR